MQHKLTLGAFVLSLTFLAACTSEPEDTVAKTSPEMSTTAPKATPGAAPTAARPAPSAPQKPTEKPAPKAEVAPSVPTIGKLAPEIIGEDIDGKPMKLSDYRGKVVMLDFWGHW